MKKILPLLLLSSCASSQAWVPTQTAQTSSYEQQRAQCVLTARQATGYRGTGIAGGLEEGLANIENFNLCMVASGWQLVEKSK